MATGGGSPRKDEEFQLSCSLCMEPYEKERPPKILQCFHTYCLKCLDVLADSVATDHQPGDSQQAGEGQAERETGSENSDKEKETAQKPDSHGQSANVTNATDDVTNGSADTGKPAFPCPACRTPVHVPEGGVAALQTNFYLSHHDVTCDVCPKESQQRANCVCQECNNRMCPSCRRFHDKFTSGHHVTSWTPGLPVKARSQRRAVCPLHPDQELCFYCGQCDSVICLHCKLTSHEGHVTSDVNSAAVRARSELSELLTVAKEQLSVAQSVLRRMERDERTVTRHTEKLTRDIYTRYDVVMASIAQSRDEILADASEREVRQKNKMQIERSSVFLTVDTLSGLVSRATCADGSDVLTVKKELQAALLSEDLLNQHKQQADRRGSCPTWTYDVPQLSAVPVTACMGRVVEVGVDDVTKPLSMKELADKLGRLKNDLAETKAEVMQNKADLTQNKADLTQTKAEVTQNKADLTQNKADLTQTKAEVTQNKADLTQNKADLTQTKAEVTQNKADLTQTKAEVTQNKADLTQNKADLTQTKAEVTQNKADLTQTKAEVTQNKADLTQTKVEVTQNKADLTQNKADLTQTKAEVTQNKADLTQTKAEVTQNTTHINTITTSVKQHGDILAKGEKMAAFSSFYIDKEKTKYDQPIVFRGVTVNEGGGYDETTGVFTAPVAGTYVFSAGVVKKFGHSGGVVAWIYVNNARHTACCGSSTSTRSSSLSVQLQAGHTVWVMTYNNVEDYYDTSAYNYFTGALVQPQL